MDCVTVVDWAATGTMLQGIGTVIGAIAVIAAAIIGSQTFKSWKRQKLAERHIEQAERILTATYQVRRSLSYVRSPAMWGHETEAAEKQLRESGEWEKFYPTSERNRLATAQAYYNRLSATRENQQSLEECQPMARAFFGHDLEKAIEKLNHQFWSVKVYVDANLRDKIGADPEFRRKIESTIWEGFPSPEENEIDQIILTQVKLIEDICVPILRMEDASRRGSGAIESALSLLRRRTGQPSEPPPTGDDR